MSMTKVQLVIIQPTSICNINCRYCYLPNRLVNRRINIRTLLQVYKVLFSSQCVSDAVTIAWHAGEPLVLPTSFYERAFQELVSWNTCGVRVTHSIQTNATLITQEWCNLFKKHNVHIGVSLDGPKHIHDANRVDRAGHGTFERAMRGVKLLQENGIKFSVIAVITKNSLSHAEELWQFFMDLRPASLGLNPEEVEGFNQHSSLHTEEDIASYKAFFKTLLRLQAQSPDPLRVREVESLLNSIQYGTPVMYSQSGVPGAIVSFDCSGNISTFSPELLTVTYPPHDSFIFGNVFEHTLEDIFTQPNFIAVNTEIQHGIQKCMETCDYFMFCGGGFPSNKIAENGTFDSTETQICRLRIKASTDAILEHLEEQYKVR